MKKTFFSLILLVFAGLTMAQKIERVEPLCWWVDMKCPLTLMFQGENLCDAQVTVQQRVGKKLVATDGILVKAQHNAESRNYLFVEVDVQQAGDYVFTLQKGKKKATANYSIMTRRAGSAKRQSFTTADVIYLIMSDRFADGDPSNNSTATTLEKSDKNNIHSRHGGDIQGIINHLDYIKSIGATTIWPTPLTLDNEPAWSYHGYACADYYHIDPRFGTNELYCQMVEQAHQKGLKVVMDIVTNHCGLAHWWMEDLPYHDWIHQFEDYTQTNNAFSTNFDPNASQYDLNINNSGWFDTHMPDMNLDNPDLLQYFKQFAIWWIEYANLDGLRVDTYPYNEKEPMSKWCAAVRNEYPNINIVGECWTRPAYQVAYWQDGAKNLDGFNSNLPSVMDFPTEEAIRQALEKDGSGWGNGMTRVYDALACDGTYANLDKLMTFVGNHDMERIADVVYAPTEKERAARVKLAITLLATMRGIPQVFAGDELMQQSADIKMGHSGLRQLLPSIDAISPLQKEVLDYHSLIFKIRATEKALQVGKTLHFMSRDNTYAFFRYTDDECIFIFINASNDQRIIPWEHYNEMLQRFGNQGQDVLTGKEIQTTTQTVVAPLSSMVIKFK